MAGDSKVAAAPAAPAEEAAASLSSVGLEDSKQGHARAPAEAEPQAGSPEQSPQQVEEDGDDDDEEPEDSSTAADAGAAAKKKKKSRLLIKHSIISSSKRITGAPLQG
jgi:hypothetical protein